MKNKEKVSNIREKKEREAIEDLNLEHFLEKTSKRTFFHLIMEKINTREKLENNIDFNNFNISLQGSYCR